MNRLAASLVTPLAPPTPRPAALAAAALVAAALAGLAARPAAADGDADAGAGTDADVRVGATTTVEDGRRADAVTAVGRVRPIGPGPVVAAALTTGYGFTEGVLDENDAHHRLSGAVLLAARPARWLEVAARLDGRYDRHTGDVTDDGWVGDPHVWLTAGGAVAPGRWLGVRAGLWLPGADAPSVETDAATVDVSGVFTAAAGATAFTATAGYRLDRSAASADPMVLSDPDRLGLGLSEFDAILAGLSVTRQRGPWQLVGEASAEILIGDGAPAPLASPLRVGVGARRTLTDGVRLEGLLEVSPGQRPDVDPGAPLVAVEPRVSAMIGLSWQPRTARPAPIVEPEVVTPVEPTPPTPPPPPPPTTGTVRGQVSGPGGAPLPGATVRIGEHEVTSGDDGGFVIDEVAPGATEVEVELAGHEPARLPVTVTAGGESSVAVDLIRVKPPAQIRGVVRSFDGKGLGATVRIDPLGIQLTAEADGSFAVDVAPGSYEVVVTMNRFQTQRRKITVEPEGVLILNIELRKARP